MLDPSLGAVSLGLSVGVGAAAACQEQRTGSKGGGSLLGC